ncbi:MAG: putative major facilitator superfamily transporter [Caulobacter sp.]|nr:putative major facilitator superfamily transporter [Caulobacter sp.]
MDAAALPALPAARVRLGLITLLMGLSQLVITSDFSLVSVALPTIGRDLGVTPALLSWVVSANATVLAGFLIVGGRLADALGHRRALGLGLVIFAAGSLLSALSPSIWMLIAARALQGLGGALVSPASFALINAFLPEGPARHRALGVFAVMQGLSVIIGLAIGGLLTTELGWRSVFFLNLPILGAALALALAVLPRAAPASARKALDDVGGALLMALSAGLLLAALSNLGAHGLTSKLGLGLLAAALAGFAAFALLERRHPSPLIPPALLGTPNLWGGALAVMGLIAGFGGMFVMLSLYLQNGLHVSAAATGIRMLPIAAATMVAGPCAPFFMRRWPLRTVAMGGLGLEVIALAGLVLVAPGGLYLTVVAPLIFAAVFGSTTAFMALMGLALARVAPDRQGAATGLIFTGQHIGLPMGVVITLAVLQALPAAAGEGALAAYGRAFLVPAVLVALALAAVTLMTRAAPPNPSER